MATKAAAGESLARPKRRRRTATAAAAAAVTVGMAGWFAIALAWRCLQPPSGASQWETEEATSGGHRHLLGLPAPAAAQSSNNACAPRSIETFPPDLFSLADRQRGAAVLHGLAALWLFAALAIVCDDYFVASLEVLCDVLQLKPDVAGATFMAAGSSAPELFTSVIGVFFTRSDVGVSTIVGSAVFNLLFIVSLCGIFATQTIILSWWPLFRDCSYYSLSVVCLILVIYNEEVLWYEAGILLAMYAIYILIMYYNEQIDQWISIHYPSLATGANQKLHEASAGGKVNGHCLMLARADGAIVYTQLQTQPDKEDELPEELQGDSAEKLLGSGNNGDQLVAIAEKHQQQHQQPQHQQQMMIEVDLQQPSSNGLSVEVSSAYESPLVLPTGWHKRLYWCATLPWTLLFILTIPDCRRPGPRWRKLFFITLINSILWIGGMSYLLVWMVCAVGDTLGIPDTVMGLTLLAAGTSVPDALASVFVARDGFGDMAVSNSVGSNVFDILIGLGLPWFIGTAMRSPRGGPVTINSAGLTYTAVILLSTVLFLLLAVYANKMRLDRRLGLVCLLLYLLFISVSVLFETNVFAQLNPPPCARRRD